MILSNVTVGCDPEVFLKDKEGKYRSSIGVIPGTKTMPFRFDGKFAIQQDNVAAEFNIPPAKTKEEFVEFVQYTLDFLSSFIKEKEWKLDLSASAEFPPEELEHPLAKIFGCDPDYNAWTGQINPRPRTTNKSLRSAGGHIHIGFKPIKKSIELNYALARAMDVFAGIPALLIDKDTKRRKLYGKAGAMRHKDYGIEYRSLSNFWLASKELMEMVYDQTMQAVNFINSGLSVDEDAELIQETINKNKVKNIPYFAEKYSLIIPK